MDKEVNHMTLLGVMLIALAVTLTYGLITYTVSDASARQAIQNLKTSQPKYLDKYDSTTLTGTQVLELYKLIQGKPYVLLIHTLGMETADKTAENHSPYCVNIGGKLYLNYNQIIAQNTDAEPLPQQLADMPLSHVTCDAVAEKGTHFEALYGLAKMPISKAVIFDNNIAGLKTESSCEFIPLGGLFDTRLLKDSSDNILGVVVTQRVL